MIVLSVEVPPKYAERTGRGPVVFIVILEKGNFERMKAADPADLKLFEYLRGPVLNAPLKELDLVIAYEEDVSEIMRMKMERDTVGIAQWLERGRKIKEGDCAPPIKLPTSRREIN